LETIFSIPLPLHFIDILETPSTELFHDESSTLWFAAKEMKRDQPLSVYVGKNEKSKVIIKLQRSSAGPPSTRRPIERRAGETKDAALVSKESGTTGTVQRATIFSFTKLFYLV